MTSTPLSWGVIGCGQIASDKTIPALLATPTARLLAFADPDPTARARVAALAPTATGYADFAALLADSRIHAVYIATPTGQHCQVVEAAAAAGKHILCEKPLATSVADAEAMRQVCARAGVRLMTAYMSRFGDHFARARVLVAVGALGEIRHARGAFAYDARRAYPSGSPGAWRWTDPVGGGPVLDIGIYLLFALREILGQPLATVSATASTVGAPAFPQADTVVAWFRTSRGIPGVLTTAFTHSESIIELIGSNGRLVLDNIFSQSVEGTLTTTIAGVTERLVADPQLPHWEWYRREVAHFTAAIQTNTPHEADIAEVLADQTTIAAISTSIATRAPVDIHSGLHAAAH